MIEQQRGSDGLGLSGEQLNTYEEAVDQSLRRNGYEPEWLTIEGVNFDLSMTGIAPASVIISFEDPNYPLVDEYSTGRLWTLVPPPGMEGMPGP